MGLAGRLSGNLGSGGYSGNTVAGISVGLGFPIQRQRTRGRVVAASGDHQLLGGEAGNYLGPVLGNHHLFFGGQNQNSKQNIYNNKMTFQVDLDHIMLLFCTCLAFLYSLLFLLQDFL